MRNIKVWMLTAVIVEILPVAVRAQITDGDANKTEIRALYDSAIALDAEGKHGEAAQAFRELVARTNRLEYQYNVGLCELSRERFDLAYEAFSIYLENAADKLSAERQNRAKDIVAQTSQQIGFLDVAEDDSYELSVDGEYRGILPFQKPLPVLPGEHTVRFVRNDHVVFETAISVTQGETIIVKHPEAEAVSASPTVNPLKKIELELPQSPTEDERPNPAKSERSPLKTIGIISMSLGGAALVTGIVTGKLAVTKADQLSEHCPDKYFCEKNNKDLYSDGKSLRTATDVLLVTGSILAVGGVVLTIVGHRKKRSESLTGINAIPWVGEKTAGVGIYGSF